MVAAGLKSDVGGGARASHAQGVHFSMRLAGAMVKPLADDLTVFHNDAADVRLGWVVKATARGKLQRTRHVHFVLHGLVL